MRSKDQLAVIAWLELNKTETPRRLARQMSWDSKHTHNILGRLVRIGIIKNTGKPGKPEYRLTQRWKEKVKQPKPAKVSPKPILATQECRENWQGYQIHKIFGSGARA